MIVLGLILLIIGLLVGMARPHFGLWLPSHRGAYTHVSSHIRARHRSSGIEVPVNSGQK